MEYGRDTSLDHEPDIERSNALDARAAQVLAKVRQDAALRRRRPKGGFQMPHPEKLDDVHFKAYASGRMALLDHRTR